MVESLSAQWFRPLFGAEAMCRVFSDRGRLVGVLDFEAALATAQSRAGLISPAAATAIADQCRAELFDLAALAGATAVAGNAAIPIIAELTRRVQDTSAPAARYVHFSATSQDALDTGLMLQVRQGLDLLAGEVARLVSALARTAAHHQNTVIAGRTWLRHAAPTTFGLQVAGWLDAVARHGERIGSLRSRALVVQFGGAVGTLAALGEHAERTARFLADELQLAVPSLPWHTHRDRLAEVSTTLGLLVGTLGKIARDIALLGQSEIAEVAEPAAPGRGASSSLPHKQNPIGCATVLAAAMRVPPLVSTMLAALVHEQDRGLGSWQAEWETLPEIFVLAAGALTQLQQVIEGLSVDAPRMRTNLEATQGLIYAEAVSAALSRVIGRQSAQALVERACRRAADEGRHLREVVVAAPEITAHLSAADLAGLFDCRPHVQAAARLVASVLAAHAEPGAPTCHQES